MASYYAIAAVSATLQGVLSSLRPPEFGDASIDILELPDFHKAKPLEEGISILLYRVGVGGTPRTLSRPPNVEGTRRLPSLPVDLYYLFTPWARTAAVQQRLLGWLMRTLEDNITLSPSELNHYGGPETIFDEGETVSLIPEPLALQDLTNLWEALKPNEHVSVAYVARFVHLETVLPAVDAKLVQARQFDYANGPA